MKMFTLQAYLGWIYVANHTTRITSSQSSKKLLNRFPNPSWHVSHNTPLFYTCALLFFFLLYTQSLFYIFTLKRRQRKHRGLGSVSYPQCWFTLLIHRSGSVQVHLAVLSSSQSLVTISNSNRSCATSQLLLFCYSHTVSVR